MSWKTGVTRIVFVVLALVAVPTVARAQAQAEPPRPFSYATYFECEPGQEWRADEIVESLFAPIYKAGVEDGTIAGWGWMAHHTGGNWRRLLYRSTPTVEGLLDAQEKLGAKINEKNQQASRELGRICHTHDDYIWRQVARSAGSKRGQAVFSMYMVCDISREERADELFKTVFAPIYDKHLGEGKLVSWGWLAHVVGGEWRRLATMTAADHKTLLGVRTKIIEELGQNTAAMEEFGSICTSHQDYMWTIRIEAP